MVELSHSDRTIKVKIVYYGPPVGGKTTNLQVLHRHADAARRGEMVSVNSAQDRTILFDLLPLRAPGFRGFDLRLQVLAVPGQAMYAATRRLVLKGADAVVFVANSAADRWEENLQSYREMTQNLITHHLDPATIPLVFQYNKRDLPKVTDTELMNRALNGRKVDTYPAVAVTGEGVLETFSGILHRTIQDLARRYSILDRNDGQPAWQWTQAAVLGLFGSSTITEETLTEDDVRPPSRSVSLKPMPPLGTVPPPAGAGLPRLSPVQPPSAPGLAPGSAAGAAAVAVSATLPIAAAAGAVPSAVRPRSEVTPATSAVLPPAAANTGLPATVAPAPPAANLALSSPTGRSETNRPLPEDQAERSDSFDAGTPTVKLPAAVSPATSPVSGRPGAASPPRPQQDSPGVLAPVSERASRPPTNLADADFTTEGDGSPVAETSDRNVDGAEASPAALGSLKSEPDLGALARSYDPSAALRSAFGSSDEPDHPSFGLLYFEDGLAEDVESEAAPEPLSETPPEGTMKPEVASPAASSSVAPPVAGSPAAAETILPDEAPVWVDLEHNEPAPQAQPMAFEGVAENAAAPAPTPPPPANQTRLVVRVTPQPVDSLLSLPEDKANTALVESYAEASQRLGAALSEMREERDLALGRLEDLRRAVESARGIAAGEALEAAAEPILRRMSGTVDADHASFLVPRPEGGFQAVALRGLLRDPVLASVAAVGALEAAIDDDAGEAVLLEAASVPALAAPLERGDPAFDGLVAVSLRTPRGLFGLALLYLTPDAARPTSAGLMHLVELARAVAASLELATTLEDVRRSRRALEMALAGSASLHGLESLVDALVELRNRLGDMRRRPDSPAWFLEEFTRCGPSLSSALQVARSLIAFSRGEIQREGVVLGDLLSEIQSELVQVEASGQEQVLGDPGLLRVALRALVDHVGGGSAPVVVQVAPAPGRVLVGVGLRGKPPESRSEDALGLPLVRRIAVLHGGSVEVERIADGSDWVFLSLPPA